MTAIARERLIEEHIGYATALAKRTKYRWPSCDFDELVSDAMVTLCERAGAFDPRRGVSFTSFLFRRLSGSLIDSARRQNRTRGWVRGKHNQGVKRAHFESVEDLARDGHGRTGDQPAYDPPDRSASALDQMVAREQSHAIRTTPLDARERRILTAMLAGGLMTDLALALAISPARVGQLRDGAIRKMRARLQ